MQLDGADSVIRDSLTAMDVLAGLEANEEFFSLANREFATAGSFSNSGTLLIDEGAAMLVGAGGDFANEGRLDIGEMGITTQAGGDMMLSAASVISFNLTIDPSGTVNFGTLNIADILSLDGDITFSIWLSTEGSVGDFISVLDTFEVATADSIMGTFANVLSGERIFDMDGNSFLLTINSDSIVFSNFSSVPEPGAAGLIALGLGSLLLRRRRR